MFCEIWADLCSENEDRLFLSSNMEYVVYFDYVNVKRIVVMTNR